MFFFLILYFKMFLFCLIQNNNESAAYFGLKIVVFVLTMNSVHLNNCFLPDLDFGSYFLLNPIVPMLPQLLDLLATYSYSYLEMREKKKQTVNWNDLMEAREGEIIVLECVLTLPPWFGGPFCPFGLIPRDCRFGMSIFPRFWFQLLLWCIGPDGGMLL